MRILSFHLLIWIDRSLWSLVLANLHQNPPNLTAHARPLSMSNASVFKPILMTFAGLHTPYRRQSQIPQVTTNRILPNFSALQLYAFKGFQQLVSSFNVKISHECKSMIKQFVCSLQFARYASSHSTIWSHPTKGVTKMD